MRLILTLILKSGPKDNDIATRGLKDARVLQVFVIKDKLFVNPGVLISLWQFHYLFFQNNDLWGNLSVEKKSLYTKKFMFPFQKDVVY